MPPQTLQDQVQIVEVKLREQEQKLEACRAKEAAEEGNAVSAEQLAEAKRRRDGARREVQRMNARLSSLQAERREAARSRRLVPAVTPTWHSRAWLFEEVAMSKPWRRYDR